MCECIKKKKPNNNNNKKRMPSPHLLINTRLVIGAAQVSIYIYMKDPKTVSKSITQEWNSMESQVFKQFLTRLVKILIMLDKI